MPQPKTRKGAACRTNPTKNTASNKAGPTSATPPLIDVGRDHRKFDDNENAPELETMFPRTPREAHPTHPQKGERTMTIDYPPYRITQRKGLSHWEPLVKEWSSSVDRYCTSFNGEDAPYYYTERANVGILASAAWHNGSMALEEFQWTKGRKYRPKWNGRADLYLRHENREEFVEAKQCWVQLGNPKEDIHPQIDLHMNDALNDARQTKGAHADIHTVGVVFAIAWIAEPQRQKMKDIIDDAIASLHESPHHLVAWSFPKIMRNAEGSDGYLYPGVFLIANSVDYPQRS